MRASFAHSWAMLAPAEQRALAALSVFTGSFTHAAARHVAEAPLPLLAALADKSLVRADDDGRFSLHALIRQCAAERLAQDPAANDAVLARHAAWFAHTMQQFHSFHAIDHAAALRTIAAELPNVLAAWDWSLQHEDVGFLATCAPGLGNYFQMRGPAQQGLALFEAAEQVMQDAGPVAGDARWILPLERASLHHSLGQYALLEQAARRAHKGARACRDAFGIRTSLNSIAIALQRQGRAAEADRYLGEALRRARHAGAVNEIPYYAANLATNRFALGRDDDATQLIQESLAQYQANRQQIGVMQALGELGTYCVVQGRTREAIDWLERGLQVATEAGVATRRCHFLGMLAQACIDLGDIAGAQQYAERARLSFEASREPSQEAAVRRALAEVALATGDLAAAGSHLRLAAAAVQRNRSPLQVIPLVRTFAVWLQRRGGAQPALLWTCWADRQSPRTPVSVTVRRALEAIRARHAPADIDAAEAAARARSLDDAIGAMTERLAEAAY
jgi:tetratricopeptide (TPR) repeat protein